MVGGILNLVFGSPTWAALLFDGTIISGLLCVHQTWILRTKMRMKMLAVLGIAALSIGCVSARSMSYEAFDRVGRQKIEFEIPGVIALTLLDESWVTLTNSRLDDFTPRPVVALLHDPRSVVVRVSLSRTDSDTVSPAGLAADYAKKLAALGYAVTAPVVSSDGKRAGIIYVRRADLPNGVTGISGKIVVRVVGGSPWTALVIADWDPAFRAGRDVDAIVDSLRPPQKK